MEYQVFFPQNECKNSRLSSAAVVIGALRVNRFYQRKYPN